MPDQPWAQTPHTLPGRIREGMCKARKKPRMERSYNGLKGAAVQSSQWMDVDQNKDKVREVSKVLL